MGDAPSRCRSCGAPMSWATTPAGKLIPLDPEPVEDGNLAVHRSLDGIHLYARVLKADEQPEPHERRGRTHSSSCPSADCRCPCHVQVPMDLPPPAPAPTECALCGRPHNALDGAAAPP